MTKNSSWIWQNKPSGSVNTYIDKCMKMSDMKCRQSIKKHIGELYPNIKIKGPTNNRVFYETTGCIGPDRQNLLTREPYDKESLSTYKLTNLHLYSVTTYRIRLAAQRQYKYDLVKYGKKRYIFEKKNMMSIVNIIN